MFGYVKVFQPELKVREHEAYKGIYCALCQTLGKRYGLLARMTLSYDFTFLALFLLSLRDEQVSFKRGRCPFHPLKKRPLCCGECTASLDYTADVAMLLVYHKLEDTVCDERFFKRLGARFMRLLYKRDYLLAAKRRPDEAAAAVRYMQAQHEVECDPAVIVDAAAEPTADFLRYLASRQLPDDFDPFEAERFAYCLGRFIYLADAADDLEKDLHSGNFNPYIAADCGKHTKDTVWLSSTRQYAAQSLHACAAVCAESLEALPIKRFRGILQNVICAGMPAVITRISQDKQEDNTDEQSL